MSISSLQESMSRKAASMAAVAKRMKNPSDIQSVQQQLIAGVQNGSIEPYVGIPLIQDLTKKLTEAKMAMMSDGPQSNMPVADQVMAQAQGIDNLTSNLPVEYADGGIISFEKGGLTPEETEAALDSAGRLANLQTYPTLDEDKFSRIKTFADEYRKLLPEKDPRLTAYEKSIIKTPEQLEARKNEDLNMALVQFGLGLANSKSPRFLGGLSEASEKTLPSLQTALSSRRTAEDAQLKMQADMARADRAEGIAALTGGLGLYNKEEDRTSEEARARLQREATLASSNKPTDMVNFVNTYVRNAKANPENKKSADALALEGYKQYFVEGPRLTGPTLAAQAAIAGGAQAVQTSGQGVTVKGQNEILRLNANKAFDDRRFSDPTKIKYDDLVTLDEKNLKSGKKTTFAEDYKQSEINKMMLPSQQTQPLPQTNQNALPQYATNPTTKERIMSTDGGITWTPVR